MISLALAAVAFVGIHIGVAGSTWRDRIVAAIGLRWYMVAFSAASVVAIWWLVSAYGAAPYLPTWGYLAWWKPVQLVLMLPAFVLVVAGLTTPNPTSVGQAALVAQPPRGVVRVTRHPFLTGVAIWAAGHVIGNGDWASFLLFGAMLVTALAGTVSIDGKRRRALGENAWAGFAGQTSIVPFQAVLAGRVSLAAGDLGWWRPAAGVLAYAVVLGGHAHLFGVSPWPGQ